MRNLIKLFAIALGIVLVVTVVVIFAVPGIRNRVLGSKTAETTEKSEGEVKDPSEAENLRELAVYQEKMKASNQVFDLADKLKQREAYVVEQEARIQRMQDALKAEREAIDKIRLEIQTMHADIAQFIPLIEEGEKKNLKKIAKMFETLSSDNANPIMARMPDQTLVIVLSFMKPRNSATLLGGYASLNPESARRAAELTEKLKKLVMK